VTSHYRTAHRRLIILSGVAGLHFDGMSAMREELHHLVDELPEAKVGPVLDLVRDHVGDTDSGKRRRLSFAGMLHAEPDLAARSEEILRARFASDSE
jgi:hypothetical protein